MISLWARPWPRWDWTLFLLLAQTFKPQWHALKKELKSKNQHLLFVIKLHKITKSNSLRMSLYFFTTLISHGNLLAFIPYLCAIPNFLSAFKSPQNSFPGNSVLSLLSSDPQGGGGELTCWIGILNPQNQWFRKQKNKQKRRFKIKINQHVQI